MHLWSLAFYARASAAYRFVVEGSARGGRARGCPVCASGGCAAHGGASLPTRRPERRMRSCSRWHVIQLLPRLQFIHLQAQRAGAERAALQEAVLLVAALDTHCGFTKHVATVEFDISLSLQAQRGEAERAALQEEVLLASAREAAAARAAAAAPALCAELQVIKSWTHRLSHSSHVLEIVWTC